MSNMVDIEMTYQCRTTYDRGEAAVSDMIMHSALSQLTFAEERQGNKSRSSGQRYYHSYNPTQHPNTNPHSPQATH